MEGLDQCDDEEDRERVWTLSSLQLSLYEANVGEWSVSQPASGLEAREEDRGFWLKLPRTLLPWCSQLLRYRSGEPCRSGMGLGKRVESRMKAEDPAL